MARLLGRLVALLIRPYRRYTPPYPTVRIYHPATHLFSRADIREGRIVELRSHRLPRGEASVQTIIHDPREVMVMARFKSAYTTLVPRYLHTRAEGPSDWLPPDTFRQGVPRAAGDVAGRGAVEAPVAQEHPNAEETPAEDLTRGAPRGPPEADLAKQEPTPAPRPSPTSHQQEAETAVPNRVASITETITNISEALNASKSAGAPRGSPRPG